MQRYLNEYVAKFVATAAQVDAMIIVDHAFKAQHLPLWIKMAPHRLDMFDPTVQIYDLSWLSALLANILSVSIAGYSYIVPTLDEHLMGGSLIGTRSDEEFIRTIQLKTFMPGMQILWLFDGE